MEIAVFALVLVAVFAAKAVSIALTCDELVGKCAAFSWMKPGVKTEVPELEVAPSKKAAAPAKPAVAYSRRARIA